MSAPSFTPQLRPLSVGEVLDAGFRLLRQRFGTLVLATLFVAAPICIVSTLVEASTNPVAFDFSTSEVTDGSSEAATGTAIARLLDQILSVLAIGVCFKAISAAYLGERSSAGESVRFFLPRTPALIVAWLLAVIAVVVGLIGLLIGALFLLVRLSMTFPAVVVEKQGPFAALGRSWSLTKGHWWRTFAVLLVVWLLTIVIGGAAAGIMGVGLAATETSNEVLAATIYTLVVIAISVLTYPLIATVVTVQYYDLRVRNEGFDLQLLARGVGADDHRFAASPERPAAPADAPVPATGGGFAPPQGPPAGA